MNYLDICKIYLMKGVFWFYSSTNDDLAKWGYTVMQLRLRDSKPFTPNRIVVKPQLL